MNAPTETPRKQNHASTRRIWRAVRATAGGIGLRRALGLSLLLLFVALRIWDPPPLEELRLRTFDLYQVAKPRQADEHPVTIVDIDEASLRKLGQWPWPRTEIADLVTKLSDLGAVAIGFDVLFSEPDRYSPGSIASSLGELDDATQRRLRALPSNDQKLADAFASTKVVVGESGLLTPNGSSTPSQISVASMGADPTPFLVRFPGVLRDIPVLENAAAGTGVLTFRAERDGIVRRVPLAILAAGRTMPSLALAMLHAAAGSGPIIIRSGETGIQSIGIRELEMPTDKNGQVWVRFSPSDKSRYVSAADVLAGRTPREAIDHKLVLIGSSATGLLDRVTTPLNPVTPGVEVHAQILENALAGTWISNPDYAMPAELVAALVASLVIIAFAPLLSALKAGALAALMAIGLVAGSWYFYQARALLIDFTFPLMSTLSVFFVVVFVNYMREQAQRQHIRSAFGQYLAPDLVDELVKSPKSLTLGGEERDMTVMFSDVRGFTALAEIYKSNPQRLTSLINGVLTVLTNAIVLHRGTIDKYMGDALMAFWNAPLDDRHHPANACRAALDMIEALDTLNKNREAEAADLGEAFVPMRVGVGVNTGACVVGNMGSTLRFNYSVLGDAVNVASRIEGQTKNYGVSILAGASTVEVLDATFATLELDLIRVKGKTAPEKIFAIFGDKRVAESTAFLDLARFNQEMLAFYRARDWEGVEAAINRLQAFAEEFGLQQYLEIYTKRVADHLRSPPPEDWDGAFVAEEK